MGEGYEKGEKGGGVGSGGDAGDWKQRCDGG